MLNFRGTMVSPGLVVTVDTRFDGGRHLRIARGIPGAHVWACGKPVWWNTKASFYPKGDQLMEQIRYAPDNAIIVLCDIPDYTDAVWQDIGYWINEMNDVTLIVMGEFTRMPVWSDIHFRTGLRIELAEEIAEVDAPVGDVADKYNVTKQVVRECRANQDTARRS